MYVELRNINKSFGNFKASNNVSFGIEEGKLVGLLGPSGSGKTTILRMIAGLEVPDEGEIFIDGVKVNNVAPGKRGIGFVFQNYALFRHMTVFENIAFGLKLQKQSNEEINNRVQYLVELIGLKGLEKRYPKQLSGGQKQRVAFARALAPNPKLLLLDEPFAAVDAKVRKELRTWLKEMINTLKITSIFVTHDQEEAVEVADEIIVTNSGQIEQKGSPVEIYKNPKSPFVAQFIGETSIIEDSKVVKGFEEELRGAKAIIRPEFVEIVNNLNDLNVPSASQEGVIIAEYFRGSNILLKIKVGDIIVPGYRTLEQAPLKEGEKVHVLIHRLYIFNNSKAEMVENKLKVDAMPIYI
ncbi:MAG: sulfate ABC transporter ATP-binding protein [Clostridium sp.]